jgi:hypothetical protein
MQTKLKEENAKRLDYAADIISQAFAWSDTDEGSEYWDEVYEHLRMKASNRTSDGKPYIDPEPPIPDGWRRALDNEHCRKDVKLWDKDKKQWAKRLFPSQPFLNGDRYIVPIDPPLTDHDACVWPRLLVMVRDDELQPWWGPYSYQGKNDAAQYPFVVNSGKDGDRVWKQARRATPEEIEAAE